jgi:hypothetical protein
MILNVYLERLESHLEETGEGEASNVVCLARERIASMEAKIGEQRTQLDNVRREVARLHYASGCSCCRDDDEWDAAGAALGELLDIPPYDDGSGFDFSAVRDEYAIKESKS